MSTTPNEVPAMGTAELSTLIQTEIQKALGSTAPASFADVLAQVDPADSEAALAMLDYLLTTGRLNRIGVLDREQGYLYRYQEPQGSTKAGYRPGGTQGDRIVDEAIEAQRANGTTPPKRGMCSGCFSVVKDLPDGTVVLDLNDSPTCPSSADGKHTMA